MTPGEAAFMNTSVSPAPASATARSSRAMSRIIGARSASAMGPVHLGRLSRRVPAACPIRRR